MVSTEVHSYATDSNERYIAPLAIAAASLSLAYLLHTLAGRLGLEYPWWLDSPTPLFLFGLSYALYDRCLWRVSLLSRLPDLSGSWIGTVSSSHDQHNRHHATLRIRQTWSTILIELETANSRSVSSMASISLDGASVPTLSYEYSNEPRALSVDTMQAHRGTARLAFTHQAGKAKFLEGQYYTGRGRETRGEMKFEAKESSIRATS
jgi:hypothetical protein